VEILDELSPLCGKAQVPNPKLQRSHASRIVKDGVPALYFDLEDLDLPGIWGLNFGISSRHHEC
jgi:hypothetical protein